MATTITPTGDTEAELAAMVHAAASLPPDSPVRQLIVTLHEAVGRGVAATVLPNDAELTPNQAAEMLHMSRPHLLTFMDKGALAFHWVGSHRRIRMSDLLDFMSRRDRARKDAAEAIGNAVAVDTESIDGVAPISDSALSELEEL